MCIQNINIYCYDNYGGYTGYTHTIVELWLCIIEVAFIIVLIFLCHYLHIATYGSCSAGGWGRGGGCVSESVDTPIYEMAQKLPFCCLPAHA